MTENVDNLVFNNVCLVCGNKLKPIKGMDLPTRKYHIKCWKSNFLLHSFQTLYETDAEGRILRE